MNADPDLLAQVIERAVHPQRDRWFEQVARTGYCERPIRLRGRIATMSDGRRREVYSTRGEPDGVLLVRCRNRRASVCRSCAYEYRGDMWQLLYAGIAGGRKGVPESVRDHPLLFVTLTALSFGAVHTRHDDGRRCQGANGVCAHGRPLGCPRRHGEGDEELGRAICPDCYDYDGAVLFNWFAPELWRRFTIALRRGLAKHANLTERAFDRSFCLSFAKVAEFQRRGVVHLHAILRLDGSGLAFAAPPRRISSADLESAVRQAAQRVRVTVDREGHRSMAIGFGQQIDVRAICDAEGGALVAPGLVAAYVSKYATKGCEDLGLGDQRLQEDAIDALPDHVARMVRAVWSWGDRFPAIRRWTHTLGFRGHFATKSRRYSVTLGELRRARAEYRREEANERGTGVTVGDWMFAGVGYHTRGDLALAEAAAAHARERRDILRMKRRGP